ncbi:MAG: type II secretory pathway component PulF [Lentimonas sp.]|jgi:type II secretory pathway component PulF
MLHFQYKAITPEGQTKVGELTAADKKHALAQLKYAGLQPVRLTAVDDSAAPQKMQYAELDSSPPSAPPKARKPSSRAKQFNAKQSQPFIENLLQLHSSGLPVAEAIQLIHKRVNEPKIKELAGQIRTDLLAGRSLADAMRKHPKVFDENLVHLVEAGEATGNLKPILTNSLSHMEANREVRTEIQSGLAYPAFVCAMAMGIGLFTVTNLIPKLQDLTEQMGGEPNALTQFMLWMADFAVLELPIIISIGIALSLTLIQWRKSPKGKAQTDQWLLRLPFAGAIITDIDLTQSLAALQLLLKNGIDSVDAMRLSAFAVKNVQLRARFLHARSLIQDGASFTRAFQKARMLPQTDLDLVGIGESTGNLSDTLDRLSGIHKKKLSQRFKQLTVVVSTLALGMAVSLVALLIMAIVISLQDVSQSILSR